MRAQSGGTRASGILRRWLLLILVSSVVTACQQDKPTAGQKMEQADTEREATLVLNRRQLEGKQIYGDYCAFCHGITGEGDGFNAYNLNPRPATFKENAFLASATEEDIAAMIREGGRSTGKSVLMPPWGKTLTAAQVQSLVAYVKALVKTAETPEEEIPGTPK